MRMKRKTPERALQLAAIDVTGHFGRQPQGFPHLLAEETITHPVARVHAELLTRRSS